MLHKDRMSFEVKMNALEGKKIVTVEVIKDDSMQVGPFVVHHVNDCVWCDKPSAPYLIPLELWKNWCIDQQHVQHVFPWMTASEREHLRIGLHEDCQVAMFEPVSK